jgi:hypothetical protein
MVRQRQKNNVSTLVHVGSTYPITSNFGGNGWKWGKPNATNLQLLMVYAYAFLVSQEVNGDGFWHLICHFHPLFDCLMRQLLVIPATSNLELGAMSPCATQGVK